MFNGHAIRMERTQDRLYRSRQRAPCMAVLGKQAQTPKAGLEHQT